MFTLRLMNWLCFVLDIGAILTDYSMLQAAWMSCSYYNQVLGNMGTGNRNMIYNICSL